MASERFLHVYGALSEKFDTTWSRRIPLSPAYNPEFHEDVDGLNAVFEASLGIQTIDGPGKLENKKTLTLANDVIANAEVVYIFGFGFDSRNVERIGLKKLAPANANGRKVFFTNYGGHARVSVAAGTALTNGARSFLKDKVWGITSNRNAFTYEMSFKNVYDSIAEDFEPMEAL
jgi:hypothetical protein